MDENVYTQAEVENVFDEEANLAFGFGLYKTLNVAQTAHDGDDSNSRGRMLCTLQTSRTSTNL